MFKAEYIVYLWAT